MADPYDLLGLSPAATRREIELAWIRARNIVDSMSGSVPDETLNQRRVEVDFAREVLFDPARRALLDDYRAQRQPVGNQAAGTTAASQARRCESCGEGPAKGFMYRQRVSKRRIESVTGLFCRTCSLATFRETSNQTLLQGFWRLMGLVSTVAVLRGNFEERKRAMALPEPSQEFLNTRDPGRPLYLRSGMAAVMVTMFLLVTTLSQLVHFGEAAKGIPGVPDFSTSVSSMPLP